MTEEEKMLNQPTGVVTTWDNVPYGVIADDISESVKQSFFKEMDEINNLYQNYDAGMEFLTEGSGSDYLPSQLSFKKAASIMNKEARFLFSTPPDFNINSDDMRKEKVKKNTTLQDLVKKVLQGSNFNDGLLKACKDCFIGKRIAMVVNFNESGIKVSFLNSLSFIWENDEEDPDKIVKFVFFLNTVDTTNRKDQRYFKKTYVLEDEVCWFKEEVYDGLGDLIETQAEYQKTELDFIPCCVVKNDGLTNDFKGKSELGYLVDYEGVYSKLANADIDAERKGMNPVRYTIDASANSTKNLPAGPGAYWDLQTDDTKSDEGAAGAKVGLLESNMAYSGALKTTLDRVENTMYSEVDVPNINSEKLQGVITSGKTISALYWGLSVRCDEKMLAWAPALSFVVKSIIEGAKKYPRIAKKYVKEQIPDIEYEVEVVNNYALPEDEQEEKNMDITEVTAQVMSRKAYMKKWRKMSDEDAEEELLQIKREQMLFEDSDISYPYPNDEEDDSQLQDSPEDSLEGENLNDFPEDE